MGYINGIYGAPYIAAPWIRHGNGGFFTIQHVQVQQQKPGALNMSNTWGI